MAVSININSDLAIVAAATPGAATIANAIAAAGPMEGYPDNIGLAQVKAKELLQVLLRLITNTDAGDATTLANLKKLANVIDGGSR